MSTSPLKLTSIWLRASYPLPVSERHTGAVVEIHAPAIDDDLKAKFAKPLEASSCPEALKVGFSTEDMRSWWGYRNGRSVNDLGLPDLDGREWLRMFRAVSSVPVVVATARDDEGSMVATLDGGADDYVVKPFSAAQLDARIRAVLRRAGTDSAVEAIEVGALRVDVDAREATLDDRPLDLSRLEFDLLAHLAAHAGTVISKRELLTEVWQQPLGGGDRTVDVHLSWLRRKLGETAAAPRYLHTVRGVGIKLVAPEG